MGHAMKTVFTSYIDEDGYEVIECPPPSESAVQEAITEAVSGYQKAFGERLAQVWIFGSRARGDYRPGSDLDLLVVLHEEGPMHKESSLLSSVSDPIHRYSGVFVDGHSTTLDNLENADDDFHYFVRQEGRRIDV